MNLNDICKSSELAFVNNEHLFGEAIVYNRQNSVPTFEVNANAEIGNYRIKDRNNSDVVSDEMSFLSVDIPLRPLKGDKITYNSETWKVEHYDGTGPYDIFCTKHKRHKSSRSRRKTA